MSRKLAGMGLASKKQSSFLQKSKKPASVVGELSSHAGFADFSNLQVSFINKNVKHNLQLSSGCCFEQDGTQDRGKDVPFSEQPRSLGRSDQ